jgi:hypothetical protein
VKRLQKFYLTAIIIGFSISISFSQPTKLAQTGFNFLSVSSDARSSAMGDAVNSLFGFTGALSHNPASMSEMPAILNSSFSINKWIADINYLSASLIISPYSGGYGSVGLSFQSIDYGDLEGTVVDRTNPNGYSETGVFSPSALAVGLGYSYKISEQFGIGAQVKYARQELGENSFMTEDGNVSSKKNKADAIAYDFGTIYKTGLKSIAFGMSVTNFSKEIKYEEEGFQLPLLFTIGVSANVFDFFKMPAINQDLLLSLDWTHPRSHPEQIKIGLEYKFLDVLSLRGGYIGGNDENNFSFGAGVSYFGVEFDYAYTPFGVFNEVQRFTARLSLL